MTKPACKACHWAHWTGIELRCVLWKKAALWPCVKFERYAGAE